MPIFCLIPNTGTFLPKSFGDLPAMSTIPGSEENHGSGTLDPKNILRVSPEEMQLEDAHGDVRKQMANLDKMKAMSYKMHHRAESDD